jgi:small ubiquitin-related modifier
MAAFDASHTSIHNSSRDQQQQPDSKRHCSAKTKQSPSKFIRILVMNAMGEEEAFTMRDDMRFAELFPAYAERRGIPTDGLRLVFDGWRSEPEETFRDLGMEDGDIVDAFMEQLGD